MSRFNAGLGNEYLWEKNEATPTFTTSYYGDVVNIGGGDGYGSYYANDFIVENGQFVLVNPKRYTFKYGTSFTSTLSGKYMMTQASGFGIRDTEMYYLEPSGSGQFTASGNAPRWKNVTIYRNPGMELTPVGYVNSSDSNAYPPAVSDGFTYNLLG